MKTFRVAINGQNVDFREGQIVSMLADCLGHKQIRVMGRLLQVWEGVAVIDAKFGAIVGKAQTLESEQ